jgi:hypothetical protein
MRRLLARLISGLTGLTLAAASTAASAATFYVVQSGADAWTIMDPAGIQQVDASVRKAWAVRVQRNMVAGDPPQPGYVRTLTEYDCDRERTRWREFSAFSRAGALLTSKVNPNPEWAPASEASDIQAAYRVVCRQGGGAAVVSAESVAKVVISLMGAWDPSPAPITPPPAKPK